MSSGPDLGTLLRRTRIEQGFSQAKLANAASVSQALVSYYERNMAAPSVEVLQRMEIALGVPLGALTENLAGTTRVPAPARPLAVEPPREAFVETLSGLPGAFAILDMPAEADGGDLAFVVDLRSHAYLVVIDGQGSGLIAAPSGRIAAACAYGATITPGGGIPSPEDIVEAVLRFGRAMGAATFAGVCVVAFEHRSRTLRMCRHNVPPPFLRSGRLAQWTGSPHGPAGAFVGERKVTDDVLLVVATDGVANMRTSTGRSLWEAPDLRTLLAKAKQPSQVEQALRKRAGALGNQGKRDDMLAVVVAPWPS